MTKKRQAITEDKMLERVRKTVLKHNEEFFQENLKELASNLLRVYLPNTRKIPGKVFTGPSLYFHQEAIKVARLRKYEGNEEERFLGKRHLEMIYAVLPSWGMHRMGKGKKKEDEEEETQKTAAVKEYKGFKQIIEDHKPELKELSRQKISDVNVDLVDKIVELMFDIQVSTTNSYLVSSSKTLHHIFPNLVPPIDREYSLRFMKQPHTTFKPESKKYTPQIPGTTDKDKLAYEKEYARLFIKEMWKFMNREIEGE